ncbi:DUF418 domain-containing protein [Tunicatimonas pelagia]|uniref:DUF418 domain-containing protein n=1 Tax=Tunicatimonas pelagia TaxID=931531 RepID=UPI00266552A7|nr:DUF418 domain-containing protein [Tunicatimonas pelagia]WKN45141.1 DUF418 domain-containing protein [Tunicatimonas pelagia]
MFTLLFGVGFYVFLERMERKDLGLKAMDIYARRLLWLFLFGLAHAYLIWNGDVLYHYAACGFFLFPLRSFKVNQLVMVVFLFAGILLYNSYKRASKTKEQFHQYTQAVELAEEERTEEDQKRIKIWEKRTQPGEADRSNIDIPRTTLYQSWLANAEHTKVHKGAVFYQGILFRTLLMMVLGIILYKLGVFHDYRSVKYYWPITLVILAAALTMNYFRYYHWTFEYFEPVKSLGQSWLFTFPKETLGLAYILLLNGLYQKYLKRFAANLISYVGRMALSNYILQSIICGLIFYGYGLGKYNQYSRAELLLFVIIIWLLQLSISWFWMRKFAQGPLEKLWRKLTYQPFQ